MSAGTKLIERHALGAVRAATADTRVVVLLGARQVGKSTLLDQLCAVEGAGRRVLTLDNQAVRAAAQSDPVGFIAALDTPVAIDEIQRAPELMTEIKLRVDQDKSPGQFALTGSANLLEMKNVKESLAGRAEYIRLYPFSQGELRGVRETFLPQLASGQFPNVRGADVGRKAYAGLLAKGGYPEAQLRTAARRARFFDSYLDGIMDKDFVALGDIAEPAAVTRLLRALAGTSAAELNIDRLSSSMGAPSTTIRRRIDLLETLFLIKRVPSWGGNLLARAIKRPKVHIIDTGLLAYLVAANETRIEAELDLGGTFFETFVATELQKQISWQEDRPELFHFRDRDGREVDLIAEFHDGSVVGIEVKSAATVLQRDFRGLIYLREKLGKRFRAGAVIYTGADTVEFGDRIAAVPLSGLWS
jgi:predicted AAA+ superfamily ATPase